MELMKESILFFAILQCLLFVICQSGPTFFRGRPWTKHGLLGQIRHTGRQHVLTSLPPLADQWFTQKLNHFDPSDERTWKQRYFVNDTFFQPGGPVFLQLGGEGVADPIWLQEGQIATNYGAKFGALLILLEHRYYGDSHPTENMTSDNLRYLTSQQSLADAATFISSYTADNSAQLNGSRWISFGGSYSGSLSAWLRLKYPHLIHGAVASSAPVQAVINFTDYLAVVRDSLGSQCDQSIRDANQQVEQLLKHPMGWRTISRLFTLCDPLDGTNSNDVANLIQNLAGNFEGVVQYNRDNRQFEGAPGTNITIDTVCGLMTNDSNGSPLTRYADVNSLLLKAYGQKCMDYSYQNFVDSLRNVSWASSAAEGGRQWTYQTCVEFGFFQSSDSADQPFSQYFPVGFFEQMCSDIFGSKYTVALLEDGVDFTNAFYGGFDLKVSRVVFPNGSIDPWHSLGITSTRVDRSASSSSSSYDSSPLVIFINGTAHCADLYPDSDDDLPQLRDARAQIALFLKQTLAQE